MEFSKKLKEIRKDRNMTQKELGEKLGVTDSAVRLWETQNREPCYATLCKIARIFDVTVGQLLGEEEY